MVLTVSCSERDSSSEIDSVVEMLSASESDSMSGTRTNLLKSTVSSSGKDSSSEIMSALLTVS